MQSYDLLATFLKSSFSFFHDLYYDTFSCNMLQLARSYEIHLKVTAELNNCLPFSLRMNLESEILITRYLDNNLMVHDLITCLLSSLDTNSELKDTLSRFSLPQVLLLFEVDCHKLVAV